MATFNRGRSMAENMVARGHEATLLTLSSEHRWRSQWSVQRGVHIGEMPNWGVSMSGEGYGPPDNLLRILHSLAHRYDIVHMLDHKPSATLAGVIGGRMGGAVLIGDWADWWGGAGGINGNPNRRFPIVGRFEDWWEIKSKIMADGVIAISTPLYRRARKLGVLADRLMLCPNGTEPDLMHSMPLEKARAALGVPAERKMVCFFGMSQSELAWVMRAMQYIPDLWLMVVGKKIAAVLNEGQAMGVADRVWQTGFVSDEDLSMYLSCANLFCMPLRNTQADWGRVPGKLMYYMAAGRPTVSNPIGDGALLIQRYRAGIVANDDEFESAIRRLLDDASLNVEMGANARRAAEGDLSWACWSKELEAFYLRILQHKQRSVL